MILDGDTYAFASCERCGRAIMVKPLAAPALCGVCGDAETTADQQARALAGSPAGAGPFPSDPIPPEEWENWRRL